MTRKAALRHAIETLESLENTNFTEVLQKLRELYDEMPLARWTEQSIPDAIAQWIEENKKQPSIYDLDHSYMPSHTTIRHVLKLNAKDYIERNFPPGQRTTKSPYGNKPMEALLDLFREEYNRLGSPSADEFNRQRRVGTPCWQTYALLLGADTKWTELVSCCNLPMHKPKTAAVRRYRTSKRQIHTVSTNYERITAK